MTLTRYRIDLVTARTAEKQQAAKLLEDAQISQLELDSNDVPT